MLFDGAFLHAPWEKEQHALWVCHNRVAYCMRIGLLRPPLPPAHPAPPELNRNLGNEIYGRLLAKQLLCWFARRQVWCAQDDIFPPPPATP